MALDKREIERGFERYFDLRAQQSGAMSPGQQLELLDILEAELEEGRVPRPTGLAKLDPTHPMVRAALDGRPVSNGATVVEQARPSSLQERLQALPTPAKIGVMLAIFLLPLLLVGGIFLNGGEDAAAVVVETPSPTPTAEPTPTNEIPVMVPTITPTLPAPTPTPYAIALSGGAAAPDGNDPASIELAGFSYILGAGRVTNGSWQPAGAEWLMGTDLRRVVAVPYEPALANAVITMRPGNVIKMRLRSGEITRYKVTEILRVQRQQIEVLAARHPSLAVVLHGEASAERTVLLAAAMQEPQEFTVYTAAVPGAGEGPLPDTDPSIVPTLVPTSSQTVLTDTRVITHTVAGLVLTVGACQRLSRIGNEEPPEQDQRFLSCEVSLEGIAPEGASYSDQTLRVAERADMEAALDWLPDPVRVPDALGAGTLAPGGTTTGNVAGLVQSSRGFGSRRSDPVLVWEQAGMRYLIRLDP